MTFFHFVNDFFVKACSIEEIANRDSDYQLKHIYTDLIFIECFQAYCLQLQQIMKDLKRCAYYSVSKRFLKVFSYMKTVLKNKIKILFEGSSLAIIQTY